MYVGKAVNLRRRLRAHFADRRWRATKPGLARAADAEWRLVGSEIEALLTEAVLIHELRPVVNIQIGEPALRTREVPRALARDVLVVVALNRRGFGRARRRAGRRRLDDSAHAPERPGPRRAFGAVEEILSSEPSTSLRLAPIVFSWLAGRGATATRLDPQSVKSTRQLRAQLSSLLGDERLFAERLMIYS